ncbi:hypothetical protein DM860_010167 [Cuscuta australis]|uniref:Pentacotripeptide-repeat region of PRORP domain-containing protein n=1 Tax=Cuscuta australis TaxID=267555 RepID=A0A328DBV4_9ASTE|nr:hypothetical protein DM860_010167 [Cuscuta australis]
MPETALAAGKRRHVHFMWLEGIFDRSAKSDVLIWDMMISRLNKCKREMLYHGLQSSQVLSVLNRWIQQEHNLTRCQRGQDSVSWTTMINRYAIENRFKDVLAFFREMKAENVKPYEFTMVSVLTARTHLGALELGEWVRTYIDKNTLKFELYLVNALIDTYFKCSDVEKGVLMFNCLPPKS